MRLSPPVVLAVAIVTACGRFDESSPASDEVPDAAIRPTDAGDAGTTSPPDGDGGAPAFSCPSGVFCDEFERDEPKGSWTTLAKHGGEATIVGGAVQGDSALRFAVPETTATEHVRLYRKQGLGSVQQIEVEFLYRPPAALTKGHINLMNLDLGTEPAASVLVVLRGDGIGLDRTADGVVFEEVGSIPHRPQEWNHARVVLDLDAQSASLFVDAKLAVGGAPLTIGPFNEPRAYSFTLGPSYADVGIAFDIDVDAFRVIER